MSEYPPEVKVIDDLGDKIVDGLRGAVAGMAADLDEYRRSKPLWVAEASERGLANWLHDRLWSHLVRVLGQHPDIVWRDTGVLREFVVDTRYRLRAKRHDVAGSISNYPTQSALEFELQPSRPFPGLEEHRLYCGYLWDVGERGVAGAVLSLHDGQGVVIWLVELLEPSTGSGRVRRITGPDDDSGPDRPGIDLSDRIGMADADAAGPDDT